MRYAIFSDIHNHPLALSNVLRHAGPLGIDRYFCLGDVGIDSCVDLVRDVGAPTVFGNWEVSGWRHLSPQNQQWALDLPPSRKENGFWLTHASFFWPEHVATLADLNANHHRIPLSKLFPYFHYESDALWETIALLTEANIPLMFHGHTHRQMAWRFTKDNQLEQIVRRTIQLQPGDTLIVGVGSVGRPADGPGAAYVIYDDQTGQIDLVRVT